MVTFSMYVCIMYCIYLSMYVRMCCFYAELPCSLGSNNPLLNNLVSTSYTIVDTINKQHNKITVGLVTYTYELSQ